jgi:hypothetical protein
MYIHMTYPSCVPQKQFFSVFCLSAVRKSKNNIRLSAAGNPFTTEVCIERLYRYAPHNDVSVNDRAHMLRWSHKIIILYYFAYHCVTLA